MPVSKIEKKDRQSPNSYLLKYFVSWNKGAIKRSEIFLAHVG